MNTSTNPELLLQSSARPGFFPCCGRTGSWSPLGINVNHEAMAALMANYYHELWINKKPPIEALREAQLMIYRRPDLIPDLAGERGAEAEGSSRGEIGRTMGE